MACSYPSDASCTSGCWSQCSSNCGGACSSSSSGSSSGDSGPGPSCTNCTNDCQDSCSTCASSNVNGWGSDDGGGCTCGGTCSGGCSTGCKNTCQEACDTGCESETALNLYNKLVAGLNKKILAADITNINEMIKLEAERRSKEISSQTFNKKEKAASTKIQALQSNLATIGEEYKTSQDASAKVKTFKAIGQELIDKALSAYEETIGHS